MEVPTKERKTNKRRREKCWIEDQLLERPKGSSAHIKRRALDRNTGSTCQDGRQRKQQVHRCRGRDF